MKEKSAGRPSQYEEKDKIAIAREYLSGSLSYNEIAKKYSFERKATVRHFVRWYQKHYQGADKHIVKTTKPVSTKAAIHAAKPLLAEKPPRQTEKDKQLKAAQLKIAALEMLIANAKKELGIDLVKKSGTKPSDK